MFHDPEVDDYVYLMADVLPSQRQSGKKTDLYHTYLIVHKTGEIHTTHCTCMAGYVKFLHCLSMFIIIIHCIHVGVIETLILVEPYPKLFIRSVHLNKNDI